MRPVARARTAAVGAARHHSTTMMSIAHVVSRDDQDDDHDNNQYYHAESESWGGMFPRPDDHHHDGPHHPRDHVAENKRNLRVDDDDDDAYDHDDHASDVSPEPLPTPRGLVPIPSAAAPMDPAHPPPACASSSWPHRPVCLAVAASTAPSGTRPASLATAHDRDDPHASPPLAAGRRTPLAELSPLDPRIATPATPPGDENDDHTTHDDPETVSAQRNKHGEAWWYDDHHDHQDGAPATTDTRRLTPLTPYRENHQYQQHRLRLPDDQEEEKEHPRHTPAEETAELSSVEWTTLDDGQLDVSPPAAPPVSTRQLRPPLPRWVLPDHSSSSSAMPRPPSSRRTAPVSHIAFVPAAANSVSSTTTAAVASHVSSSSHSVGSAAEPTLLPSDDELLYLRQRVYLLEQENRAWADECHCQTGPPAHGGVAPEPEAPTGHARCAHHLASPLAREDDAWAAHDDDDASHSPVASPVPHDDDHEPRLVPGPETPSPARDVRPVEDEPHAEPYEAVVAQLARERQEKAALVTEREAERTTSERRAAQYHAMVAQLAHAQHANASLVSELEQQQQQYQQQLESQAMELELLQQELVDGRNELARTKAQHTARVRALKQAHAQQQEAWQQERDRWTRERDTLTQRGLASTRGSPRANEMPRAEKHPTKMTGLTSPYLRQRTASHTPSVSSGTETHRSADDRSTTPTPRGARSSNESTVTNATPSSAARALASSFDVMRQSMDDTPSRRTVMTRQTISCQQAGIHDFPENDSPAPSTTTGYDRPTTLSSTSRGSDPNPVIMTRTDQTPPTSRRHAAVPSTILRSATSRQLSPLTTVRKPKRTTFQPQSTKGLVSQVSPTQEESSTHPRSPTTSLAITPTTTMASSRKKETRWSDNVHGWADASPPINEGDEDEATRASSTGHRSMASETTERTRGGATVRAPAVEESSSDSARRLVQEILAEVQESAAVDNGAPRRDADEPMLSLVAARPLPRDAVATKQPKEIAKMMSVATKESNAHGSNSVASFVSEYHPLVEQVQQVERKLANDQNRDPSPKPTNVTNARPAPEASTALPHPTPQPRADDAKEKSILPPARKEWTRKQWKRDMNQLVQAIQQAIDNETSSDSSPNVSSSSSDSLNGTDGAVPPPTSSSKRNTTSVSPISVVPEPLRAYLFANDSNRNDDNDDNMESLEPHSLSAVMDTFEIEEEEEEEDDVITRGGHTYAADLRMTLEDLDAHIDAARVTQAPHHHFLFSPEVWQHTAPTKMRGHENRYDNNAMKGNGTTRPPPDQTDRDQRRSDLNRSMVETEALVRTLMGED